MIALTISASLVIILALLLFALKKRRRNDKKRTGGAHKTVPTPPIEMQLPETVETSSPEANESTDIAANEEVTVKPRKRIKKKRVLSKAELTPHALSFFTNLKAALPPDIATRLRSNRLVVNHGSYSDLFLFDIWDSNQSDVLDRKHFKYCLAYDPARRNHRAHDGYFHLWLNTIRIYRDRKEIVRRLEAELPKAISRDFKYDRSDRAISAGRVFSYPTELSELSDLLVPWYKDLIMSVHPILVPIIDQFSTGLGPGERRAVVASRGKIKFTHPGIRDPERVRKYTRSIPPSWKPVILEKYDYRCFICHADLRIAKYHIDHWIPFSKGGTSEMHNLKPLCASCNLKKGNRDADTG